MSQAITTSIRLPLQIRKRLEKTADKLNQGKNGVIIDALQDYFQKIDKESMKKEAKDQSVLASKQDQDESTLWEDNLDLDDWKN